MNVIDGIRNLAVDVRWTAWAPELEDGTGPHYRHSNEVEPVMGQLEGFVVKAWMYLHATVDRPDNFVLHFQLAPSMKRPPRPVLVGRIVLAPSASAKWWRQERAAADGFAALVRGDDLGGMSVWLPPPHKRPIAADRLRWALDQHARDFPPPGTFAPRSQAPQHPPLLKGAQMAMGRPIAVPGR